MWVTFTGTLVNVTGEWFTDFLFKHGFFASRRLILSIHIVCLILSLSGFVCLNIWYVFFSVYLFPSFGHLTSLHPSFLLLLLLLLLFCFLGLVLLVFCGLGFGRFGVKWGSRAPSRHLTLPLFVVIGFLFFFFVSFVLGDAKKHQIPEILEVWVLLLPTPSFQNPSFVSCSSFSSLSSFLYFFISPLSTISHFLLFSFSAFLSSIAFSFCVSCFCF